MRVDHVIPYIGDQSSGPSQSVPGLCNGLFRYGVQVELHALAPLPKDNFQFIKNGYPWRAFPYRPLGCSPQMRKALCERAKVIDIMHNNSIWMMPNIYPGMAVRNTTCKLVTAPRGTMTEFAMKRSWWKKTIALKLGQKATLDRTDMFHATSDTELADIRRLGWMQPVAIVPNGITIPEKFESEDGIPNINRRILLYISRIHPEKRLDTLLKVWQSIESKFSSWDLWVCGPLKGTYPQTIIELAKRLSLKRVIFKGEVVGKTKADAFRQSELFVLPTNTENFGMAVAEALSYGIPAIVTRGAPWSGLNTNQCGWWIENGENALYEILMHALSLPREELRSMGLRGRDWMKYDFSWDRIAEQMYFAYDWLIHGGKKPAFVYTD